MINIEKKNIYAVPLLKNVGYGYIKNYWIGHTETLEEIESFGGSYFINLIMVYNKFSKNLIASFDGKDCEWLTLPLLLRGRERVRGNDKWIPIEKNILSEEDFVIPEFRKPSSFSYNFSTNQDKVRWRIITDLRLRLAKEDFPYKDVKHIAVFKELSQSEINLRLTIEYLKINKINPEDFFTEEELNSISYITVETLSRY